MGRCQYNTQTKSQERFLQFLQGVEIGPLLGKGSFGCVYKGRWKGAMVAIKVLEHALILQDDISRETLLSTSIAHPGVVRFAGFDCVAMQTLQRSLCICCCICELTSITSFSAWWVLH